MPVISSEWNSPYNAIHPNLFVDDISGRWFLTFGAFDRIMQVELAPGGDGVLPYATPYHITDNLQAQDAPIVIARNTQAGV
jgi:hypothetical protein